MFKLPSKLITRFLFTTASFTTLTTLAQENYEIQVYSAPTVEKGSTMVELHSNFTARGSREVDELGMLPTNHVFHETLEITHGWTSWFETGFYFFNSLGAGGRSNYVGSHIRPRVAVPENFRWPVGVSLSFEYGFQKNAFSPDTRTLEIRPIVDKKFFEKLYVSVNPTFSKSFRGPSSGEGFAFSPNVKASYDLTKKISVGSEYYGSVGPVLRFSPSPAQQHQLFGIVDIDFGPRWEFNAGVGWGLTEATDRLIIKTIIGHRFGGVTKAPLPPSPKNIPEKQ